MTGVQTCALPIGLLCIFIALILGCGGDNGVTPPTNQIRINSVTPNTVGLGARSIQLTISGSGFAAGATADLGPGIDPEKATTHACSLVSRLLETISLWTRRWLETG